MNAMYDMPVRLIHILAALISLLAAPSVIAQEGPAGNTHPSPDRVAVQGRSNPLGVPPESSPLSPREKHDFAQRVDLSPLRDLSVFHRGRVKILETLAQETIRTLTGLKHYVDPIPVKGPDGEVRRVERLEYDPLFTLIDLIADRAYYSQRPLIHVENLALRRRLLERNVQDSEQRERWMRLTRLSPSIIASGIHEMARQRMIDSQLSEAMGELRNLLALYRKSHNNLLLVAPPSSQESWRHISTLPKGSSARQAFSDLGAAWRDADAKAVNDAAERLAEALPKINPEQYPTSQRRLEAFYNRLNPFEYGAWLYGGALLSLLLAFSAGRKWLIAMGVSALSLALTAHAVGFALRWVIAERLPIQNQFESMTGLALGGALVGAVIMLVKRQWLFGAAASAVGFLILIAATQTSIPGGSIDREAAILNTSYLLKYHVTTVLVSYGLITLGAALSAFYLAAHYLGARGSSEAVAFAARGLGMEGSAGAKNARLLEDLDRAQLTVLQLAFWTLGVGVLLGAWWADHSWGRWWAFDPKETWALITWIVYLIVVHVRVATGGARRGLITAWLSLLGFVVMLWTYFGVNLLLPGLHAYA